MIEVQYINKILSGGIALLEDYGIGEEHFSLYKDEFNFICEHKEKYGVVPDQVTFFAKFQDFPRVEVTEPDSYLVENLCEEATYNRTVAVLKKLQPMLQADSNEAVSYLKSVIESIPSKSNNISGTDIIKDFDARYDKVEQKLTTEKPWFIPTGFQELDDIVCGWSLGEELVVIFARTGQGKSWILEKTLAHAWQIGYRVGCISPEMSPEKYGYRFDTLFGGYSNKSLTWGKNVDLANYKKFGEQLKEHKNPFLVPTPKDFQKRITVSKIRQYCKDNKLDILGIDGITYLTDERYRKGDNKTTTLTNISEDLMALSLELQIPILVVVQSNRQGVKPGEEDGTPELENIRDSDGISHNATKVISIRQKNDNLEMSVKKNRDGATGATIVYCWDIDTGRFDFSGSEGSNREQRSSANINRTLEKKIGVDCF